MKLGQVLRDLARDLEELKVEFAVVGGIASSARGEPRFTRDIGVVVAVLGDEQAESVLFRLSQRGYIVMTTVEQDTVGRLATARLQHPSGVVCDLIFATCGVEEEINRMSALSADETQAALLADDTNCSNIASYFVSPKRLLVLASLAVSEPTRRAPAARLPAAAVVARRDDHCAALLPVGAISARSSTPRALHRRTASARS